MANVNGNNMDDLFRQASDQYPLRTDSSDWNRLAGSLEADPYLVSPQGTEQDNKRRRKRFLLLLLPLMAGGLGYYAWQVPAARKGIAGKEQPVAAVGQTNNVGQANAHTEQSSVAKTKAVPTEKISGGANAGEAGADGVSVQDGIKGNAVKETGNEGPATTGAKGTAVAGRNKIEETGKNAAGMTRGNRTDVSGSAGIRFIQTKGGKSAGAAGDDLAGVKGDLAGVRHDLVGAADDRMATAHDPGYSTVIGPRPMTKGDISVTADVRAKANRNSGQDGAPSAVLKKNTMATRRHSIYVGILGAPDLSTIEFQAVKSVGTTFGILGGYTLNSKWSLETGVYLDKKEYYTDGHYFSTEKVPALQNQYINLQNVTGSCNMVEIPINLRYNLFSGQHRVLFATTGLNTYLMSKEQYQYKILWNGSPQTRPPFTYNNPYHYLFSIVDMSIGYEQKLGKIGNLRIEPYLRIPLSGIGTGNLSILSAGLNLGITRRIW